MTVDAVVVGAGPNGLAAAITLLRSGRSVRVVEAGDTIGGGARTQQLTLPGFRHDVCSAIHPLALVSPFFRELDLPSRGVEFVTPPVAFGQPLDDGSAALCVTSVDETAEGLGVDGRRYRELYAPLAERAQALIDEILFAPRLPRHPFLLARFGLRGLASAATFAKQFSGPHARALFSGVAAHSIQSLHNIPTAAFGLVLNLSAHIVGWPVPVGGSQVIVDAMADDVRRLGGEIVLGHTVESLDEFGQNTVVLADVTPRQLVAMAGSRLPAGYVKRLMKYRYGPGVFKLDLALDGPIPWKAERLGQAGTVHVGGTFEEVAAAEEDVVQGRVPERPFILLAQQSLFDDSRAPAGKHTMWAYCHVPHGFAGDLTDAVESQVERFAPGFRDRVIARHAYTAPQMQAYNANYVGGDINGGVQDLRQLFTRPTVGRPYVTPDRKLYLCSSSTPPGGGVHGMCGMRAAKVALRRAWR